MALVSKNYADARVLAPQGRLDHANCEAFGAELAPHLEACARESQTLVLDLSRLEYVSSAGLRCFMLAGKQARAAKGRLVIAAMQPLDVSAFLESFCAAAGVDRQRCLRLNLVLEELFVNTVRHGHRRDCDAPVWIILAAEAGRVHVTYEDTAPPFNPYAHLPLSAPDSTLEMRKIGGLGVLLTRELAATRDYAYLFGRNRIRLALKG